MSPIVSEQYEFVIGVDTHAATHTFALVAGRDRSVRSIMRSSRPRQPGSAAHRAGCTAASATGRRWSWSRAPAPSARS